MYHHLFEPIKIRGMELKNRIILPAMGTRMADNRAVTKRLVDYHVARAEGGCALNIVEVASVHTPSAPHNFVGICEDDLIPSHKALTDAVHKAGGKVGIQLWQGSIAVSMDPTARVFAVNDLSFGPHTIPAITKDEIKEIVEAYGKAAKRCVEAGYDCIEFHCAHNYLPHSFLSGGFNHRTDEYGGSFKNRVRFPLECIEKIRENIPDDMPLFMRIDAHDDYLPNGMTIEDTIAFCQLAHEAGVDVLDVSRGNIVTPATIYEVPPIDVHRAFNIENAAKIRKATGMLTIGVGRINQVDLAERLLEEDQVDMVVMGRAQLADPEFVNKAKEGRIDDIVHCIGCNQGCYDGFCDMVHFPFITCLRNPMLGHEKEYALTKTETVKTVWIAGGGMAGLEAAKILKERGHHPVIFEKSDHLGGQFITAGQAPDKEEMKEAAISFGKQVERMGVEIHYQTTLTPEMIQEEKPDEVIIAIGASPIHLPFASTQNVNVYDSHSVLDGKDIVEGETAVIGGGLVGLETADALASKGNKVHVIEQLDKAGKDLGSLRSIAVMQKMQALQVEILTNTKFESICENGILCSSEGNEITVPCKNVVIAVGSKANDSSALVQACEELHIPSHIIGDAKQARRALNAIHEAFDVARNL